MENTIPYHLHCEDNSVVPVLVTPYVKKAKRTCVTVAQRTEIIESATSIETQISQVPELVLHPYQSTTIKKNAPAKFKAQTEINKQQQLQSIRDKLGKSKKFQSRDNQVLRLMSEPKLLTKYSAYLIRIETI